MLFRSYPTSDAAFQALDRGEIDFLMASNNTLLSQTNYREQPGFKASIVFDYRMEPRFGFNREDGILRSIVDEAQLLLRTDIITEQWTRRVFDYRSKFLRDSFPYLFLFFVILLTLFVALLDSFLKNKKMGKNLEKLVKIRTQELEIQTEAAQVASRAKSDFLARVSHEIRTPLNAIIGMTRIARSSINDTAKALLSIDEVTTASTHLLAILNNVLDMSKIESGKFEIAQQPFTLLTALQEVSSIVSQRCKEKSITFDSNYKQLPNLTLCGDKLRLNQVIINLLGNAIKFTDLGGHVGFFVEVLEETEEEVLISFEATDDGIGMSEEQAKRLFVAFEQADKSISSRFGGTGLGLAISQNLVRLMGGEITIKSELDVGSTFRFELRFAKADAAIEEETRLNVAFETLNLAGKRLLCAEDVEINRVILHELLASTNLEIHDAENGARAVEMFEKSSPGFYDLIFMDIQMPVLDGYEATTHIRQMERPDAQNIPILAMTANAYQEDINKALAVGMNGHLSKPIEVNAVFHTLAKILNIID